MTNVARNFQSLEDILRDVSYQMSLTYMPIATPNPSEEDDTIYRVAMTAVHLALAMVGDYWTSPDGPRVRDILIEDLPKRDTRTMEVVPPRCPVCLRYTVMVVNIAEFNAWQDGMPIQEAFPTLGAADREVLMTGIHHHCWDKI